MEKIIKIYGKVTGDLWYGGEATKDFEYYLDDDINNCFINGKFFPDNVIVSTRLSEVYRKITTDGDFDGGCKIDWAFIEVTEWKDEHRARKYCYELTGKIDKNNKYFN